MSIHSKSVDYIFTLRRKNLKLVKNSFEAQYDLSQDTTNNEQSNLTATNVFLIFFHFSRLKFNVLHPIIVIYQSII